MDRPVELLPELPSMGPAFARALLPRLGERPATVPDRTVLVAEVRQDRGRLADYARVCGFTLRDQVPPTWLHVLTFPLQVHLLGDPTSAVRLAGVVHVSNGMELRRPVGADEVLQLAVRAEGLRPHRRGALVDLVGEVRVADELVWTGRSTYLAPGLKVPAAQPAEEADRRAFEPQPPIAQWKLPPDLGRQYRAVSGDPNPIHSSRLAAKAFGFARPIIHGMWTHARLLAAIESRLPSAYHVEVAFTKPILLPATVGARWHADDSGWSAAVTTADGAKPYLLATIS